MASLGEILKVKLSVSDSVTFESRRGQKTLTSVRLKLYVKEFWSQGVKA